LNLISDAFRNQSTALPWARVLVSTDGKMLPKCCTSRTMNRATNHAAVLSSCQAAIVEIASLTCAKVASASA
jgi:hypothetical protein